MANEITGCTPDFIVDNSKLDGEEEEVEQFVNDNGFVDLEDSEVGNSVAGESLNEDDLHKEFRIASKKIQSVMKRIIFMRILLVFMM